jgi:hypothetical protein
VNLFYGRSIDVRRENWAARLDAEQAKLISKSNETSPSVDAKENPMP